MLRGAINDAERWGESSRHKWKRRSHFTNPDMRSSASKSGHRSRWRDSSSSVDKDANGAEPVISEMVKARREEQPDIPRSNSASKRLTSSWLRHMSALSSDTLSALRTEAIGMSSEVSDFRDADI